MFLKQLRLLLWKNFILRKRHWVRTLIEILWPLFLFVILVAIRKTQLVETVPECHYPARAMPSAGVYPWLKSILCDLQNPCFTTEVPSEVPGQVNSPSQTNSSNQLTTLSNLLLLLNSNTTSSNVTSQLNDTFQTLTTVLQNIGNNSNVVVMSSLLIDSGMYEDFLLNNLSISSSVAESLLSSNLTVQQALLLPVTLGQRSIVCNETTLATSLTVASADISDVSRELCNLTDEQLSLLSTYTTNNVVNTTTTVSLYQTQVGDTTDISSLVGIDNILGGFATGIQSIQPQLTTLLSQDLSTFLQGNNSFLSSILGFDPSSSTAASDFCGHPQALPNSFLNQFLTNFSTPLNARSSAFCDNFLASLGDDSILSDTIKPLLLGKIPYSPNTPLVRSIIQKANSTFETFGFLKTFGANWQSSVGPALYQQLESGTLTTTLRTLLETTQLELLAAQFNVSVASLEQLKVFLSNDDNPDDSITTWKDVFRQINDLFAQINNFLSCIDLDKFVGFDHEYQLVDYSLERINNKTLWGSVVFLSPSQNDVTLPKIISYKIRQDAATATDTTDIKRFFWRPGAEAGTSKVKYYINGFVHIQDMIENALVLTASGSAASNSTYDQVFGKYLQEMPYPCYTRDSYWRPGANAYYGSNAMAYYSAGFLFLQDMIEHGIINRKISNLTDKNPNVSDPTNLFGAYMQQFPYPCYTYDEFLEYLSSMLSLLMTLAWIYSVCIIIKNIVYEKEQRLKEVMKMMGLSNGVHWVAWFINAYAVMLISILLLIIVLKAGAVTPFSNMFIVLLWLMCFAVATISQCFLISCFFSRANLAAACGGILYFALYIPYNMVYAFEDEMTYGAKLLACLLSSVAFGYGSSYISRYEMSGDGIQFSNWSSSPDPSDQLNFLTSLIMMLVDAFIYLVLTWYIENVFPGTYGVPKPWYFFMTSSYWCGSTKKKSDDNFSDFAEEEQNIVDLEEEPTHLPLGVSINKLRKVYGNGKVAVDNLSLNFYEGQITSFLGHNGAGKTTTMSMLTGLFTPTSGSASIYGNDIQTEMDHIRYQLGFCPQHNVLFGDLTVLEHLQLYSGLKNAAGGKSEDKEEIKQMLDDVGLPQKKNEMSRHLSGGMKRKLSVAVAFVGGSKCVILDEPTAGVDPYARRGIWDLLLRYRNNRTILLSTHHMDEADLLGDRIAIISHGKLKCCGSSLFLKSTFGVGYFLTVVKSSGKKKSSQEETDSLHAVSSSNSFKQLSDNAKVSDEGFESNSSSEHLASIPSTPSLYPSENGEPVRPHAEVDVPPHLSETPDIVRSAHVTNLVMRTITKAKIQEENPKEITFVLPYSAQDTGKFTELFSKLDEEGVSYGLTDTSLEEIFLNVAEHSKDEGKEESTKCCFCIPRRKKPAVTQSPALATDSEGQARLGLRRRDTLRSNCSGYSALSESSLASADCESNFITPDDNIMSSNTADDGSGGKGSYKVSGNKLVRQQFKALFVKRFHHAKRNTKGLIAQVLVPAVFVALALVFTLILPAENSMPSLLLQPWMYGDTFTFLSKDLPDSNLTKSVGDALLNKPTIGMRCVNNYQVIDYNNEDYIKCVRTENGAWTLYSDIGGFSQELNSNQTLTCSCTDKQTRVLLAECPNGAGGIATPRVTTQSSDFMYNMTGRNVSDWLVKTVENFLEERYGGLSLGEIYHSSVSPSVFASLVTALGTNLTINSDSSNALLESFRRSENAEVWFDNNGYHSMPTWLNILNNAALRATLSPGENPADYGIASFNHPLNFTTSTIDLAALSQSISDTLISIAVIFALSFVPASFVLFLIEEKITKSKHLQFVSGVNQTIYWITTFLWDMVNYFIPIIIVVFIFLCFQTKGFVSADNFPCFFLLLLLYGFAITPMMYPSSFYFEVPSTAYVVLTCINLFIGINTSLATFILELLDDPNLDAVNNVLVKAFLIFPQYCLGRGLIDMALNQAYADAYAALGIDSYKNPFTFDLVGRNLLALAVEGVVFFVLTILIQYRFFIKPKPVSSWSEKSSDENEDEDVAQERKRLQSQNSDDILKITNLTKVFRKRGMKAKLVAVNRLYVGVPKGECFGLLGVNGAGKTTTFKMLTGDISPTAGDAYICNQSILDNIREVQQNTGYCPQFDALNSLLTGREHLIFYAKLRGVPPEECDRVADWAIEKFGLKMYAKKPAGTYSGGNKRKLSAAIAFIGCPPIVFLDEPTAGMDPMARRFLWSRIAEAVRGGRCIVLTSHSMEECEALCTKLAIMVNGKFQCLGSPQHLKNKYGEGYTITIKVGGLNPDFESVQSFISSSFNNTVLKESHCNMLMYQVPLEEVKLAELFSIMQNNKDKLKIEDYSVSQTTLDEVFVSFAKDQTDGVVDQLDVVVPSGFDEGAGSDGNVVSASYPVVSSSAANLIA